MKEDNLCIILITEFIKLHTESDETQHHTSTNEYL